MGSDDLIVIIILFYLFNFTMSHNTKVTVFTMKHSYIFDYLTSFAILKKNISIFNRSHKHFYIKMLKNMNKKDYTLLI